MLLNSTKFLVLETPAWKLWKVKEKLLLNKDSFETSHQGLWSTSVI